MIYVDRNKVTIPSKLIAGCNERVLEEARVMAYLEELKKPAAPTTGKKKPKKPASPFALYNDPTVKPVLRELFKEKCAYCETIATTAYIGDIEHFRPKGEIKEASPNSPGYYWLAAEWDNLLLSCRNCNQLARHEIFGKPLTKTDPSLGKMNQFPLADESKRIREHSGSIATEDPYRLLINPCIDNPELFFEYDEKGNIKPKKGVTSKQEKMAETSINVFVLRRALLVRRRKKKIVKINDQKQRIEFILEDLSEAINDPKKTKKLEKRLDWEIEKLLDFQDEEEEYLGVARQLIPPFLAEVKKKYKTK